jgi:predicted RNA methylase
VFDFSGYRNMVDLAGGSGACAIAACQKNPRLKAVIVDFPNVIRIAEELVTEVGLSDRITTQPGDISKDDWPEGDLMLISLVISAFSREDQVKIVRKCFQKLPSGGAILVHDFLMNQDYKGPLLSALYNLTLAQGVPMSARDMGSLFEEVGFVNPFIRTVIPEYTAMVTAEKP